VEGRPGLVVLDLEGRRGGLSYTIDTVEDLRREHPAAAFDLLVGSDMLADLPGWRRAGDIVRLVRVVGFERPGVGRAAAEAAFSRRFGPDRCDWVEVPAVPASSSGIRDRLRTGRPVEGLLDPKVLSYIRRRGLYGLPGKPAPDFEEQG
jgi:nicotinate-nucleotide adenylyltransferase